MEHSISLPPQEVLPLDIQRFMVEWLERNNSVAVLHYIYDQYRIADSYNLTQPVFYYTDYLDSDEDRTGGKGARSFAQGMLFGFALAYDWLTHDELSNVASKLQKVSTDFSAFGNKLISDDEEEPDWTKVLLAYGREGLDMVSGLPATVTMCAKKVENDERLHDYFKAGAGMMMKVVLIERNLLRKKEVEALNRLYEA